MTVTSKNWEKCARALDLRLQGKTLEQIGRELGVSRERARQLSKDGGVQLANRVFFGVKKKPKGGTGAYDATRHRPIPKLVWYVDGWIIAP